MRNSHASCAGRCETFWVSCGSERSQLPSSLGWAGACGLRALLRMRLLEVRPLPSFRGISFLAVHSGGLRGHPKPEELSSCADVHRVDVARGFLHLCLMLSCGGQCSGRSLYGLCPCGRCSRVRSWFVRSCCLLQGARYGCCSVV